MRFRVNDIARPRTGYPYAFKDYFDDGKIHQSMVGFLETLWKGAPGDSCFFLATSNADGNKWREHVVHGDNITVGLDRFFREYSRWDFNLYFCPNPFSKDRRKKEFARPTRLSWCDMDASDPRAYQPQASLVWATSPGRYQALWLWDRRHSVDEAEGFSRALTERHGGDAGWTITKMLRIPGSVNHKPHYQKPFVRLVHRNRNRIRDRPAPPAVNGRSYGSKPLVLDFDHKAHKRLDVLKKYRRDLDPKARALIRDKRVYEKDRSDQIFHMVAGLHEVGATADEIASVIWNSPYFQDKYPGDLNALRAELSRILSKIGGAA